MTLNATVSGLDHHLLTPHEGFDIQHWDQCLDHTQRVFDWLPSVFRDGKSTYCLLNVNNPTDSTIPDLPQHYDRYVISFHLEYPRYWWIEKFCQHFSDREVVLITQFDHFHLHIPNLRVLCYDVWPEVLELLREHGHFVPLPSTPRTHKLSALCNRVSQIKAYVVWYLYRRHDADQCILSWHCNVTKPEDLFFMSATGNARIDDLTTWMQQNRVLEKRIIPDRFSNTPLANFDYSIPAYLDCVVNCTNESWNHSYQRVDGREYVLPGPYLTEKTWKPLLSGTALLPAGQYNNYRTLESLGFRFDYPWDLSYDDEVGDLKRFDRLFDVLDSIMSLDLDYLRRRTQRSNEHNQRHILQGGFTQRARRVNQQRLEKYRYGQ
jgi:hypothetical protein